MTLHCPDGTWIAVGGGVSRAFALGAVARALIPGDRFPGKVLPHCGDVRPSVDTIVTLLRRTDVAAVAVAAVALVWYVINTTHCTCTHMRDGRASGRARAPARIYNRVSRISESPPFARARALSACVHLVYNCGARRTHDLYKIDTIVCSVG